MAGIPTYPTRQGRAVHMVSRGRVAEQHGRGEQGRSGSKARGRQAAAGWAGAWGAGRARSSDEVVAPAGGAA